MKTHILPEPTAANTLIHHHWTGSPISGLLFSSRPHQQSPCLTALGLLLYQVPQDPSFPVTSEHPQPLYGSSNQYCVGNGGDSWHSGCSLPETFWGDPCWCWWLEMGILESHCQSMGSKNLYLVRWKGMSRVRRIVHLISLEWGLRWNCRSIQ